MTPALETVYYPRATPFSHQALTFLGLAFEKVHFPGVYIPPGDFDRAKLKNALDQVRQDPKGKPPDYARVMNAMIFALHHQELRDFCVFSENPIGLDSEAEQKARLLALDIVRANGGFVPTSIGPKVVPWTEIHLENGVMRFPSALEYPANALLYATAKGIPVVNDDPRLPVLSAGTELKDNVAALSAFLAAECLRIALPKLPHLSIPEIVAFRHEFRGPLIDFRNAMVRLSADLNGRIRGGESLRGIQRYAQFVVETNVSPTVSELEVALQKSPQPFLKRAFEAARTLPELAMAFSSLSPSAAASALGSIGNLLFDISSASDEQEAEAKRTGYYYLLKLRERAKE